MKAKLSAFWARNSALILRLIVTQAGCTFFGLILTLAGEMFFQSNGSYLVTLVASCFATLFYLYLQFYHVKTEAEKDKIRVEAGRIPRQNLRGLWASLAANALNLLLALLAIVGKLFVNNVGFFESFSEDVKYTPLFAVNLTAISDTIAKFIEAMYLGLINAISPYNPLMLLVIVLPSLAVCTFTYWLFTHQEERN